MKIKIINEAMTTIDARLSEISTIIDGKSPITQLSEFYEEGNAEMQRLKAEHGTLIHPSIIDYVKKMKAKEAVLNVRLKQYKNFQSLYNEQMELTFERNQFKNELSSIQFYAKQKLK